MRYTQRIYVPTIKLWVDYKESYDYFSVHFGCSRCKQKDRTKKKHSQEISRMFGNYWSCAIQLIFLSFQAFDRERQREIEKRIKLKAGESKWLTERVRERVKFSKFYVFWYVNVCECNAYCTLIWVQFSFGWRSTFYFSLTNNS